MQGQLHRAGRGLGVKGEKVGLDPKSPKGSEQERDRAWWGVWREDETQEQVRALVCTHTHSQHTHNTLTTHTHTPPTGMLSEEMFSPPATF